MFPGHPTYMYGLRYREPILHVFHAVCNIVVARVRTLVFAARMYCSKSPLFGKNKENVLKHMANAIQRDLGYH